MEELDLKELLDMFWKKRVQIVLIICIFIVLGAVYAIMLIVPKYQTSTTFILSTGETFDITLIPTYSELVKSKKVLGEVVDNLGIDRTTDSIKDNIIVTSVKSTELVGITVQDEDPQMAVRIANETVKVFTELVQELYTIEKINIVDEAELSETPYNINYIRDILLFAIIGFFASCGYVFIANMLDTTIKTPEELEERYGVAIVTGIPMYSETKERNVEK